MKNATKTLEWYRYVAKNIQQVEMIQRRAARWARVLRQIRQCH